MFDLEVKVKVTLKVIDKNITLNLKLTTGHAPLHLGCKLWYNDMYLSMKVLHRILTHEGFIS